MRHLGPGSHWRRPKLRESPLLGLFKPTVTESSWLTQSEGMNPRALQVSYIALLAASGVAAFALMRLFGEGSWFDGASFSGGLSEWVSTVLLVEALTCVVAGFALLHRQRWVLAILAASGSVSGLLLLPGVLTAPALLAVWSPRSFALGTAFFLVPLTLVLTTISSWRNERLIHPT